MLIIVMNFALNYFKNTNFFVVFILKIDHSDFITLSGAFFYQKIVISIWLKLTLKLAVRYFGVS
jgi:hypothetical protein